jgi:hypothetical protein
MMQADLRSLERRLALVLEEAHRRLPGPWGTEQLQG